MASKKRKPIHVHSIVFGRGVITTVVCNDGTMWAKGNDKKVKWERMEDIPNED